MSIWEYRAITANASAAGIEAIETELSALGSIGWEVVGFAAADKTIGLNAYTVLLKRSGRRWRLRRRPNQARHPDPVGRFQHRYLGRAALDAMRQLRRREEHSIRRFRHERRVPASRWPSLQAWPLAPG